MLAGCPFSIKCIGVDRADPNAEEMYFFQNERVKFILTLTKPSDGASANAWHHFAKNLAVDIHLLCEDEHNEQFRKQKKHPTRPQNLFKPDDSEVVGFSVDDRQIHISIVGRIYAPKEKTDEALFVSIIVKPTTCFTPISAFPLVEKHLMKDLPDSRVGLITHPGALEECSMEQRCFSHGPIYTLFPLTVKCSNRFLEERTFIEVVVENKILKSNSCLTCFVDSMHLNEYRNPTEDEVPRHPTQIGHIEFPVEIKKGESFSFLFESFDQLRKHVSHRPHTIRAQLTWRPASLSRSLVEEIEFDYFLPRASPIVAKVQGASRVFVGDVFRLDITVTNCAPTMGSFSMAFPWNMTQRSEEKSHTDHMDESREVAYDEHMVDVAQTGGIICCDKELAIGRVNPRACKSIRARFLALRSGVFHLSRVIVTDHMAMQRYRINVSFTVMVECTTGDTEGISSPKEEHVFVEVGKKL